MSVVTTFSRLLPTDTATIKLIAHWYLNEWSIPPKDTIQSLSNFPKTGIPFHVVMSLGGKPIATGGVYNQVNLLKVEPRFQAVAGGDLHFQRSSPERIWFFAV